MLKLFDYFKKAAKERKKIFKNKEVLTDRFTPDQILHRDSQIEALAKILAPALHMEKPSNIFIFGKPGTGKTLVTRYVTSNLKKVAEEEKVPLDILYVNCKMRKVSDTEYRVLATLVKLLGKDVPATGLPTDEIYRIFFETLDERKRVAIIIFDEIDELVKKIGDNFLYNFTRINENLQNAIVSLIGISNDVTFIDNLDPRVKSSLSEEEIIFPPYDAEQLKDILWQRAKMAFHEGAVDDMVISKCAAYAAKEHGDARRALDLLRVSGEIAEREGAPKVMLEHVDKALEKIERDRVLEIVRAQPTQSKLVLLSIIRAVELKGEPVSTGDVYEVYEQLARVFKIRPITQRRISDLISEWDMFGIISARVVSKGKYGRTRDIYLGVSPQLKENIVKLIEETI